MLVIRLLYVKRDMPEVKGSVGNKLVTLHKDTQFSGAFIRKEHEFE